MAEYNIVFDKANGVITAKLRRKCGQSGNWETIYSQDVTNDINMIKEAQNIIDSLKCEVCGSTKVNVIHNCKDCESQIDISNWRDRTSGN